MTGLPLPSEFSRPQRVDHIPPKGLSLILGAEPAEREAVARRLDLPEVALLQAELELKPLTHNGFIAVNGRLTARVTQTCGVTLQPVPAQVDERFHLTFAPAELLEDEAGEVELWLDEDDPPDPITDGIIDLGEVVVEQLALALDPFPRAEGARFEAPPDEEEERGADRPNPFAVLASWKPKAK